MKITQITAKKRGIQKLENGHPWIYKSDLIQSADEAGLCELLNEKDQHVAYGLFSPHSQIAFRYLSHSFINVNKDFFKKRILQAYQLRQTFNISSNAFRVVHGESDFLPSLIVDKYHEALSFQTLSAGLECFKEEIIQALIEIFNPKILVERNDVSIRHLEKLELIKKIHLGKENRIQITENNLHFWVDLLNGQKTGAFLDQRENRILLQKYAQHSKKALDIFAYQGWFSMAMAKHALTLESIDISTAACQEIEANAVLNDIHHIKVIEANAFDYLRQLQNKKEKFDLINLDPPAFVKNKNQLKQALKGYKEVNLRAMKLLEPGGILFTSSCSHHLSEELFLQVLQLAARDAKKKVQILQRGSQGPDHPALLGFDESFYLKSFALRVLNGE